MGYDKLNKLANYVLSRVNNLPTYAILVVIIGRMGSGKTTLAKCLASKFAEKTQGICYYTTNVSVLNDLSKFKSEEPIALIVDDVSFQLGSASAKQRELLYNIFRVRHILSPKAMLVFNAHYSRSIAPFLRSAQVRILTSISEAEIKAYENEYLFTTSSLWDYLHYTNKYVDKFIILAHVFGKEHIIDMTNNIFDICREIT